MLDATTPPGNAPLLDPAELHTRPVRRLLLGLLTPSTPFPQRDRAPRGRDCDLRLHGPYRPRTGRVSVCTARPIPDDRLEAVWREAFRTSPGAPRFEPDELCGGAPLRLYAAHLESCEVHVPGGHPVHGRGEPHSRGARFVGVRLRARGFRFSIDRPYAALRPSRFQPLPSHRSATVSSAAGSAGAAGSPAAMYAVAEVHDTPHTSNTPAREGLRGTICALCDEYPPRRRGRRFIICAWEFGELLPG